jgi:glutathione S-transferase
MPSSAGAGQAAGVILCDMKLYNFFASGTSFRTRIALNLKGLPYDYVPVNLRSGEHRQGDYQRLSADMLVPTLDVQGQPDQALIGQSMATIEYLEIHPINNMRILKYLSGPLGLSEAQKVDWYNHWVTEGLAAYERRLQALAKERAAAGLPPSVYSYGDQPTLADCCLIPQMVNGRRFGLEYKDIPLTQAVFDACMKLDAFERAHPRNCPDYAA